MAAIEFLPGPRWARPSDMAELIRLRHILLDKPGAYYASNDLGEHQRWERSFADWLTDACSSRDVRIAVIDTPDRAALAACGMATIDARPPGPGLMNGRCGWIQSVVTDTPWRSRGLANSVMEVLMRWLADAGVMRTTLHTTPEGRELYRRLGFEPCGEEALIAVSPGKPAGKLDRLTSSNREKTKSYPL